MKKIFKSISSKASIVFICIFALAYFVFLADGFLDMAIGIYNTPWYSRGLFFAIFKYPVLIVFFSISLMLIYYIILGIIGMIRFFITMLYRFLVGKE